MACSRNLERSSGAFVVQTTTSVIRTYQDTQTQNADTSGAGQPSRINTPTGFTCLMCQDTSHRPGQIKRLRCSHEFHQSCIDMWLNNNKYCPLCLTPYIKSTRQHQRSKNRGRNAGNPHRMENSGNLIRFPDTFAVPSFSAMLAGTNENPQLPNIQETNTSKENHLHNNSFPVGNCIESTGNSYRSPGASVANTAVSLFPGTDQGTTSSLVHNASSSEGQTLRRYTPMDTETPMDIDTQTQFNHFSDSSAMPTSPTQSAHEQETRTSREHQLYSILVENRIESTGHLTRSSFTSALSRVTRTYQDDHAAVVKDRSTSGEDQTLSIYTPMDLDTPTEFHFV